jgi:APA family basic amino acid/polyamine antiporter
MIFSRVKSLDRILESARHNGLQGKLGAIDLILLGIGSVIGTGIFVLTSEAAQKAGPAMMISFVIAGIVCGVAALCYAELASMVPVSGSAYTYTYATVGEPLAWMVGWALVLEYAIAGSAVAVGWSGYFVGQLQQWLGITLPEALVNGPYAGGFVNLPAMFISLVVTGLLLIGTTESARVNAVLVIVKIAALLLFIVLAIPAMNSANFHPFMPTGLGGITGAAASIFFAYIGFDAVSTAAEETRDPQRTMPIGLIGSLLVCTVLYLLVAAGSIGFPLGAQPLFMPGTDHVYIPGSIELHERCQAIAAVGKNPLVCSNETLAYILRVLGHPHVANLLGLVAMLSLPSVILMMIYGQTRIFFVMARDGLLPPALARIHPRWKTPHLVTWITGGIITVAAALLPVGKLADISNSGTLFAFVMVAIGVVILRYREPDRPRPFRTPVVLPIAGLTVIGCVGLYVSLPRDAMLVFPIWSAIGLVIYFGYSRQASLVGKVANGTTPS